jgi:hypothetical protein
MNTFAQERIGTGRMYVHNIDNTNTNTAFKDKETNKIIDYGYVCYYRINPYDLQYMEYSSPEDFEVFQEAYAMTRSKLIESELASCKEFAKELQAMRQENM